MQTDNVGFIPEADFENKSSLEKFRWFHSKHRVQFTTFLASGETL